VLAALESGQPRGAVRRRHAAESDPRCRPRQLVKGGDWKPENIVGSKEVQGWGGSVHRIPFLHERSTTALLKKIRSTMNTAPQPTEITLHQQSRSLEIAFDDGARYKLPYEFLRVYSPSAEVRGHGEGQEVLQVGKAERRHRRGRTAGATR